MSITKKHQFPKKKKKKKKNYPSKTRDLNNMQGNRKKTKRNYLHEFTTKAF